MCAKQIWLRLALLCVLPRRLLTKPLHLTHRYSNLIHLLLQQGCGTTGSSWYRRWKVLKIKWWYKDKSKETVSVSRQVNRLEGIDAKNLRGGGERESWLAMQCWWFEFSEWAGRFQFSESVGGRSMCARLTVAIYLSCPMPLDSYPILVVAYTWKYKKIHWLAHNSSDTHVSLVMTFFFATPEILILCVQSKIHGSGI